MASRITGACLGLLAFVTAIISGLIAGHEPRDILSRSIIAMIVFCLIGLAAGAAVSIVVREHVRNREAKLDDETTTANEESGSENSSTSSGAQPMDT